MTHTFGNLAKSTAMFYVLKATSAEKTPGVLHADCPWDSGNEITLVTTAPTVTFGTVEYSVKNGAWSTAIPKVTDVGEYDVLPGLGYNGGFSILRLCHCVRGGQHAAGVVVSIPDH
jgi:hypothetical protein